MLIRERLQQYIYLMRLNKPIGILLLLWPTLWALWLASHGQPDGRILFIFIAGVVLMRSAGCVVNDIADRNVDSHVERTRTRPLASKKISAQEALVIAGFLSLIAFVLVLHCNLLTIFLAVIGALLAIVYPLMKRFTHLPQVGLGVAFTWGVPMAFAALNGSIGLSGWLLFFTGALWPLIYDTMYAMVDKNDDLKIGVKSTAILFGQMDRIIIALLQLLFIVMLIIIGLMFRLHVFYYASLVVVGLLFLYQQWLIKEADRQKCFHAFLNNNWVGCIIFLGILVNYLFPVPYYKPQQDESFFQTAQVKHLVPLKRELQ